VITDTYIFTKQILLHRLCRNLFHKYLLAGECDEGVCTDVTKYRNVSRKPVFMVFRFTQIANLNSYFR